MTVRPGCGFSITRPHLDSICLRPYVDPNRELPWWLNYWDTSADSDDTPDTLSVSTAASTETTPPAFNFIIPSYIYTRLAQNRRPEASTKQKQVLEVLMEKITSYQENVKRNIKESCPIWHNIFHYKTETCATLERFDTLGTSVRYRVHTIRDITEIYKHHYRRNGHSRSEVRHE